MQSYSVELKEVGRRRRRSGRITKRQQKSKNKRRKSRIREGRVAGGVGVKKEVFEEHYGRLLQKVWQQV